MEAEILSMPRSSRRSYSANLDDWNVTDCLRILWRHKAALLWITLIGGLGAAVITRAQPPVYQSRALVEVQTLNENFLNLRNVYLAVAPRVDGALYLQTQAELLQQDSLLKEVARKLHLERRPEYQTEASLLGKLREDIRIVPLKNTRIIQVFCDALDPSLAAEIANTLAQTFIEQDIESRQRSGRQTYDSLQLELEQLGQRLPQQRTSWSRPPTLRRAGGALIREAGVSQRLYKTMLREANDARTASVVRQPSFELIAPAEPRARSNRPNLPLNLAIGMLDGLVLAIAFVMLREQNARVLRAPGDAESLLGLPELGAIPGASARTLAPLGFISSDRGKPCVGKAVLDYRSSCLAESFRGTLTSILSSNGNHPRVLVVTSSRPQEGKTTILSNLGFALAEIGRKTLLIDGDLGHPQLHEIFDQPKAREWSDEPDKPKTIEVPLDALVKRTAISNLFLLPCGGHADAVWDFRDPGQASRLFQRFRQEFEYVLVDSPPCFEFTGARNLARYTDGLVLVVRANYTRLGMVQIAKARLENDGFRVVGTILNRWNPSPRDRSLPLFAARAAAWNGGL